VSAGCAKGDRELKQKNLLPVFGSQGIVSEVLSGKRSRSVSVMRIDQ
jgi:antitoxin component HigA of HigAB toxin-antitoxin module